MNLQKQSNRQQVTLDTSERLGSGGEAHVYLLHADPVLVAKVYHAPTLEQGRKLAVMLNNPPDDPARAIGHISITWPTDLLLDGNGAVTGYLMPRVQEMRPVFDFYTPTARRRYCPGFDYSYLHRAASNLASTIGALHERGYVIGDINESNVLLDVTALATIVDTDSFQVRDPNTGRIYRCPVGKPDFTPPELQGRDFKTVDRTIQHDLFGLGVLIFKLLLEGAHPFDGRYKGAGDPPMVEKRIAAGHFPHGTQIVPYVPRPSALPFAILHPELRRLFGLCFEVGQTQPHLRPTAQEWRNALNDAAGLLQTCTVNDQHRYGPHLSTCLWCQRAQRLGLDPFPSKEAIRQGRHLQPLLPAPTAQPIAGVGSATAQPATWPNPRQHQPVVATATMTSPVPANAPIPQQVTVTARNRPLQLRRPWFVIATALGLAMGIGIVGIEVYAHYPDYPRKLAESKRVHLRVPFTPSGPQLINPSDGADMVLIPAGEFTMGSNSSEAEQPPHKVSLDAYYIYKNLVTVKQYMAFCAATNHPKPEPPSWGWKEGHVVPESWKEDHPIVNVSWDDANAYAQWAGGHLPTEAQWEKAARGTNGRKYPWGNDWDANKCATSIDRNTQSTEAVGSYPSGASPYGVLDMAGNVEQWCADWYNENYYKSSPGRNPTGPASTANTYRVLRGGSWNDVAPDFLRCSFRYRATPDHRDLDIGFRCVVRSDAR